MRDVRGGREALVEWLRENGVRNVESINNVLDKGARGWKDFYDKVEIV